METHNPPDPALCHEFSTEPYYRIHATSLISLASVNSRLNHAISGGPIFTLNPAETKNRRGHAYWCDRWGSNSISIPNPDFIFVLKKHRYYLPVISIQFQLATGKRMQTRFDHSASSLRIPTHPNQDPTKGNIERMRCKYAHRTIKSLTVCRLPSCKVCSWNNVLLVGSITSHVKGTMLMVVAPAMA